MQQGIKEDSLRRAERNDNELLLCCVAFKKLKKVRIIIKTLVKDGLIHFQEKKWKERMHVTTTQLGLNGIGLSKTNHIVKFIWDEVRWEEKELHTVLIFCERLYFAKWSYYIIVTIVFQGVTRFPEFLVSVELYCDFLPYLLNING